MKSEEFYKVLINELENQIKELDEKIIPMFKESNLLKLLDESIKDRDCILTRKEKLEYKLNELKENKKKRDGR